MTSTGKDHDWPATENADPSSSETRHLTQEAQDALRKPFPPEQVGNLPRVFCRACSDNKAAKHCDRHEIATCQVCRNRITTAHLHLSYVGHAAVVDRLLSVDPLWDWRPVTKEELEVLPAPGPDGMWIKLQVLGHERFGYGDSEGKNGADAVKARLSDAIKNAAQRFGVAIDLWSKEDLSAKEEADAEISDEARRELGGAPAQVSTKNWGALVPKITSNASLTALASECKKAGEFTGDTLAIFRERKKVLDAEEKAAKSAQTASSEGS